MKNGMLPKFSSDVSLESARATPHPVEGSHERKRSADDVVYAGAVDGLMYALNPDGSLLWTFTTGSSIQENCPALSADKALYFSSSDKNLYSVKD